MLLSPTPQMCVVFTFSLSLHSFWSYFSTDLQYHIGHLPTWGVPLFSVLSFCLFIHFMGFSRQEYWSGLPFPSPGDHILSKYSKVQCCKEQYCIGTWNVRSMNQGKLEMVKQEMARVNIDILGISELKWTGMGEFNSNDHYISYYGQKSLRRNGVALMVIKRVQNAVHGCNLKNNRVISVHFQGKPFSITVIQVCAPTTNAEEAEIEPMKTSKTF